MRPTHWLLCCLSLAALFAAEERFWDKGDPAQWTPQQVTQFTSTSPWAKQVNAVLISNESNMAGSAPSSGGGGRRGGGGGVISSRGSSSSSPGEPIIPKWQALVRWVSAKPMLQVLKVKLPDSFHGRYVVSVSGIPFGRDTTTMSEQTTLQMKRGEQIHPETAYLDPNDEDTVYFAFLPSMLDASSAKAAEFRMVAGAFEIRTKFNLNEMKIRGAQSL